MEQKQDDGGGRDVDLSRFEAVYEAHHAAVVAYVGGGPASPSTPRTS